MTRPARRLLARRIFVLAAAFLAALAPVLALSPGAWAQATSGKPGVTPASAPPRATAPAAPPPPADRIDDVAATERSVVRVVTIAMVNGEVVGFGHGSGFAIAPNRIVTNAHVVADAAEYPDNVIIGIVPSEGTRGFNGRLVTIDRRRDLAIVELAAGGRLPPASLFTGTVPQRQTVFALGYPGNVDLATAQNATDFIRPRSPVASDGIISSSDTINGVEALVHDADIARGNSGGPLVDGCGRVIGVNTFISRADDGDSPFSFAVTMRELSAFLREAGQSFSAVTTPCLTAAEAAARDAALTEEQRIAAAAAERARAEQAAEDARRLEGLQADTRTLRENVIAVAIVLFGGAILAGAMSMLYQAQNRPVARRNSMIAAGALALLALIAFILRPDPSDVTLPAPAATAAPELASAPPRYGALSCRVDPSRGRITVSAPADTPLDITPAGCVNGRTQYVRGAGQSWSRTLVPEQDSTVTNVRFDAATGESVTRRWFLPLDAMEAVRRQRAAVETPACTADAAALEALSRREAAIAQLLPANPNEEIVSRCVPVTPSTTPAPTPAAQ